MNAYLCGAARRTRSRVRRVRSLDVAVLRAAAPGHGPAPHMRTRTGSAERGEGRGGAEHRPDARPPLLMFGFMVGPFSNRSPQSDAACERTTRVTTAGSTHRGATGPGVQRGPRETGYTDCHPGNRPVLIRARKQSERATATAQATVTPQSVAAMTHARAHPHDTRHTRQFKARDERVQRADTAWTPPSRLRLLDACANVYVVASPPIQPSRLPPKWPTRLRAPSG